MCKLIKIVNVTLDIIIYHLFISFFRTFEGVEYKKLRVSINALLKNIILIVKTCNVLE